MKILMVNKFLYPKGGAETYMLRLGDMLEEKGHTVSYFGMYDEKNTVGNTEALYTGNMDFHAKTPARFLYPFRIIYSLEAKRKIKKLIKVFQPDIIHLNNINFQLTPSVIDAAAELHIPVVWTMHDYQTVCPNHLLFNLHENAVCERCISGSKWNCSRYKCIHGSRIKSILGSMEALLYRMKKTYSRVSCFICPSEFLEGRLLAGRPEFQGRTVAIHNFIELSAPPEAEILPEKEEKPYVLFAGRLALEKGIGLLAETAELLPDVRFVAAGSGPDRKLLEPVRNVELPGFLTGDTLKRTIQHAEMMLVPSVWYENCPLSILEAQSFGTPVITAARGGMAELVEDGKDGILADPLTAENLAKMIRELLDRPEKIRELSDNCISKRDRMITLSDYTGRIEEIYRQCIGTADPVQKG